MSLDNLTEDVSSYVKCKFLLHCNIEINKYKMIYVKHGIFHLMNRYYYYQYYDANQSMIPGTK